MDLMDAVKERHSVRSFNGKAIEGDVKTKLLSYIEQCTKESGLHIQLITNAVAARAGTGFYTKIDLGTAKYHFEIGAGRENFHWEPQS